MNKKLLLYTSIIIVFTVCGTLYVNNLIKEEDIMTNEIQMLESNIEEESENSFQAISDNIEAEEVKIEEESKPMFYTVYICGAVKNPDVYTLSEGSRINDVLNMAGGALEEADLNQLNLAEKIYDSQKIYVPKKGEQIDKSSLKVENREGKASNEESGDGLININTASAEQLQTLPGIGAVIAQNIIEYRESHGAFSSIEEIQNVSRIGQKTFQKIKDKIIVR
ncbi:MAG: competence protein ComEA [Epulopiscium sp.]|nr:competence protein ComEA [Candidatus Epulonipiscium sp.]